MPIMLSSSPREPSCKPPPKPSTTTKPLVCNIYAAPTSMPPSAPKPNISAIKPKLPITSKPSSSTDDQDNLIDLSVSLENLLDSLAKDGITKATAMSASDKVGSFHNCCSNIVDTIPATGRFRFR